MLPYKKTSKKLKEMETEQGKIETMLVEMDSKLTDSIEDLSRLELDLAFKISMSLRTCHIISFLT